MILVGDGKLVHQGAAGLEDGIESVAIARQDHPRRQRPGAAVAERVKRLVDNLACIGLVRTRTLDADRYRRRDLLGDRARKLRLEAGCRSEMMEDVGMRSAD